jgi:predicted AlkP superfamily pyrophosphatase or phosphodiesterase
LLIDGLGAELLDAHAADAPVLAGLRGRALQVGFPSTTVSGLAAVGTGCRSGMHGMVGMSFRLPGAGLINALRWRPHPWGDDLRDDLAPEQVQPMPTTFERAASAGVAVSVVCGAEFTGSGLTRAVLRGARYVGVHGLGDLAACVGQAVADGGFCYGYHGDLDLLGHLYGPGSAAWRMQLRQVDRLVESVVDRLPPRGLLAVVADHGMVAVDTSDVVDVDDHSPLLDGVQAIGGEPRARHVYVTNGAADAVLAAWRETLGQRAWVVSGDEAIAAGWFGERVADRVRPRIGDVVVAARGAAAVVRRTVEPLESSLIGHHGSLTSAEQRVPLLLVCG